MLTVNVKSRDSWQPRSSRGISGMFSGPNQVPSAAVSSRNSQIKPGSYLYETESLVEKTE